MSARPNAGLVGSHRFGESGDSSEAEKRGGGLPGWDISENDVIFNVSESTWRNKKETVANSCQTEVLTFTSQETQAAPVAQNKPVQTDAENLEMLEGQSYPPSLFAFFAKVTEQVCEVLDENQDPFLNDLFSDYHQQDDEPQSLESQASKLFELKNEKVIEGIGATCIGWSKSGSQVAVGYGHDTHDGWCSHQTPLSVWNINRAESVNTKVPSIEVEFTACISSLEFHPQENNLLAVGLQSGEVALVDLSVSSYFIGTSGRSRESDCVTDIQACGHAKQIIGLKWVRLTQTDIFELFKVHPSGSSYALLTAATDGYITLWSVSKSGSRLHMEKQFIVSAENLSEEINVGNRYKLGMKELGLTSLSTCGEDPTTFVFSTHGSFIFQGFLLNDMEVSETSVARREKESGLEDKPLYDPISNVLMEEIGFIVAVDCSPFHRNLFLYVTKEGSCFLQNLLKPMTPTLSIALDVDAVATDVQWSRSRPMVLAIADRNLLKVYDLKTFHETSTSILQLEHGEQLLKIAFNKNRKELVACSDVTGVVHIWSIPETLTETQPNEIDDLIRLSQSNARNK